MGMEAGDIPMEQMGFPDRGDRRMAAENDLQPGGAAPGTADEKNFSHNDLTSASPRVETRGSRMTEGNDRASTENQKERQPLFCTAKYNWG
jgi:hypothetical protein